MGMRVLSTNKGIVSDAPRERRSSAARSCARCSDPCPASEKKPIELPAGVTLTKAASQVTVKGPKGELVLALRPEVDVKVEKTTAHVSVVGNPGQREVRAYHGLTRALLSNMVTGVHKGYEKRLEIQGVGWNAAAQGNSSCSTSASTAGHDRDAQGCHGRDAAADADRDLRPDKHMVGHMAASIRKRRPPEPYKGKGIRHEGEVVKRKAGKSFGT
jgi:large subunit ribosomal protein L6